MKKFILLSIIALCMLFVPCKEPTSLNTYIEGGKYSFYVKGEVTAPIGATAIKCGNDTIVECNLALANEVRNSLTNIKGESVTFIGSKADVDKLIKLFGLNIVREDIGAIRCIYGNTPYLTEGIVVNGYDVNCEIAIRGNTVTVGHPVIMISY